MQSLWCAVDGAILDEPTCLRNALRKLKQ